MTKKGNLLIIEDEISLATNLSSMLETRVDHIYVANDGINGLTILNREPIHCVICDVYMPEMTGIEVIRRARENGHEMPFIFFTAFALDEIRDEISRFSNSFFLVKPDIEGLILMTDKMLKRGFEDLKDNYS